MITLTVNGKKETFEGPTGLPELLDRRQVNRTMVAVGYNGQVVHRDHWGEVVLGEGDALDIVQMVGGG